MTTGSRSGCASPPTGLLARTTGPARDGRTNAPAMVATASILPIRNAKRGRGHVGAKKAERWRRPEATGSPNVDQGWLDGAAGSMVSHG